jgi:hypothetical protein
MTDNKTHIYFVPGLAASAAIFEFIRLPESTFEMHIIEWLIPESAHESLEHYAQRMSKYVEFPNAVLVGVSFGGVMVQEMKKYVQPKQVIIISSIKNRNEMPRSMRFAQITHAHKLLPTQAFSNLEKYERFAFTNSIKSRIHLYKKYLSMRDPLYLPWAVDTIVNWTRTEIDPEIIHIHGTDDFVFPVKYIKNFQKIERGTHVMIINKAQKISAMLEKILNE